MRVDRGKKGREKIREYESGEEREAKRDGGEGE